MEFKIIVKLAKVCVLIAFYNVINMAFVLMLYTIKYIPVLSMIDIVTFVIILIFFIFQNSMLSNFIYKRIDKN